MSPPTHIYNLDCDEITALVLGLLGGFFSKTVICYAFGNAVIIIFY